MPSYPDKLSDTSPHTIVPPPLLFCPNHQSIIIHHYPSKILELSIYLMNFIITWPWLETDTLLSAEPVWAQQVWSVQISLAQLPLANLYRGQQGKGERFKVGAATFKQAASWKNKQPAPIRGCSHTWWSAHSDCCNTEAPGSSQTLRIGKKDKIAALEWTCLVILNSELLAPNWPDSKEIWRRTVDHVQPWAFSNRRQFYNVTK